MAFEEALQRPISVSERTNPGSEEVGFEATTTGMLVKPKVQNELNVLREQGVDADTLDIAPTYELPETVQLEVDRQSHAIGKLEKETAYDTLFDPQVHSAGAKWAMLSKRAIALWALKKAGDSDSNAIAPLINPSVYDEPLFDGKAAIDVLRDKHPRSAGQIIDRYKTITTSKLEDEPIRDDPENSLYLRFIQDNGFSFLSSREFLTGVLDSRAVDTRALAASHLALNHVIGNPDTFAGRPLVTASLACGAAAPMFELNQSFADAGVDVKKNILVDIDPMALASAVALGRAYNMEEKVDAQLQDIVGKDLTDFIEPHSVDVVDILGIVDYLPTSVMGYRAAENFIGKIANIMRPGGIIVAGNALTNRPHQAFFERVWPKLQQRDPLEMVDIIERAGYSREDVTVRVPQREGVYGVYGIQIPAERELSFKEKRSQLAAKKLLTIVSKFNKY